MVSPTDNTFAALLRAAKEGDVEAANDLFARLADSEEEGGALLAIARGVLPNGDRARDFVESRDLMQSALRSGWLDVRDFRGETPAEFMGWMRGIVRRKLGRVVRKKRPRPGGDHVVEVSEDQTGEDEGLALLLREEVRVRVREAIERLPEDQRSVMDLRLQGLKAPQIAVMLCLKPETVRKRESRASARLRELLATDSQG